MGSNNYLKMKTGQTASTDLISSDFKDIGNAAKKLANHAFKLVLGLGIGSSVLQWIASVAAIYLLVLDRTNWRTKILTALLIPYIFLSLPYIVFSFLRGEVGEWVTFIGVVVYLFFSKYYPDWLEMPGALLLLIVVAPSLIAEGLRDSWIGVAICLGIGCYLLQEHIRASEYDFYSRKAQYHLQESYSHGDGGRGEEGVAENQFQRLLDDVILETDSFSESGISTVTMIPFSNGGPNSPPNTIASRFSMQNRSVI